MKMHASDYLIYPLGNGKHALSILDQDGEEVASFIVSLSSSASYMPCSSMGFLPPPTPTISTEFIVLKDNSKEI